MQSRNMTVVGCAVMLAAGAAWAQAQEMGRRGNRPVPRQGSGMMVDRLVSELDLTPEQIKQVNDIVKDHMEKMRTPGPEGRQSTANREYAEKSRELRQQIRQAHADNDQAKAEALRKELDGLRTQSPQYKMREALLADVEKVLNDDQRKRFNEIKDDLLTGRGSVDLTNPGMLRMALRSLELNDEQNAKIKELFDAHRADRPQPGPSQPYAERQAAGKQLLADVEKVLTEEQRKQLKAWSPEQASQQMLRNPRVLRRSVDRLDLTEEQKDKIDALFDEYERAQGAAEPGDRQPMSELRDKLRDDIMAVLTDEQKQQLLRAGQGRDRGNRGMQGMGRRGAGAPPAAD